MKTFKKSWMVVAMAMVVAGCGKTTTKNGNPDPGGNNGGGAVVYRQIERLGRPGINEALVLTNPSLNAFNSIPPTVDLTSAASPVIAEAATTLIALYAGVCFINGALQAVLGAGTGVQLKPAGKTCGAVGLGVLNGNAIGLNPTFLAEATEYANLVAGLFLPDVLRIHVNAASGYNAQLCGGPAGTPAFCGGRKLDNRDIDITYAFLTNGETAPSNISSIRNGTYYTANVDDASCNLGVATFTTNCSSVGNTRQGHKAVSYSTMPWSPIPF